LTRIAAIRWVGLFHREGRWDGEAAIRNEITSRDERPAEPLWRGRSLIVNEYPRAATIGLGYAAHDIARAWDRDAWSEYEDGPHGVRVLRAEAVPVSLRSARRRDTWLREWDRGPRPFHHGEVVLRSGAQPACIVVASGQIADRSRGFYNTGAIRRRRIARERRRNARALAEQLAAELGLPIREVGPAQ